LNRDAGTGSKPPVTTRMPLFVLICVALGGLAACSDGAATREVDSEDAAPDSGDVIDTTPEETAPEVEVIAPRGRVVINEVDCRSDPSEWVELMNIGDAPVELAGYRITDRPGGAGIGVPAGELMPGKIRVVHGDFGISCEDDGVYLSVDGRSADQAPPRRGDAEISTWGRVPDGTGAFEATAPTPLKGNIALTDLRSSLFETPPDAPLPIVDLYVDEAAEQTLRSEQKVYAPALWSWTDASGTSPPQRIDLRIKGSITLRPWDQKPSLKIHFARHDERGPRSFRGAKKLTLHNLAYDPSAVREWLAYDLMREAGQPAPRVGWVVVRVNGVSKHLYALVESYDEVFLDDWFESTTALYEADGDLAGGLAGFFLDEGESMAPLEALAAKVIRVSDGQSQPTEALPEIDWVQLAGMFGLEDVLQHTDGMRSGCHNYFMHIDPHGKWSFLPWSVDLTLLAGYGEAGPIGTCNVFAQLCDRDEQCAAWFERARDEAAQIALRGDFRARAMARAERVQAYAWASDEPWGTGDFWGDHTFDLPMQASLAVDLLEQRARAIRCATAAHRTDPATAPEDNPTCGGFLGGPGGGPKLR